MLEDTNSFPSTSNNLILCWWGFQSSVTPISFVFWAASFFFSFSDCLSFLFFPSTVKHSIYTQHSGGEEQMGSYSNFICSLFLRRCPRKIGCRIWRKDRSNTGWMSECECILVLLSLQKRMKNQTSAISIGRGEKRDYGGMIPPAYHQRSSTRAWKRRGEPFCPKLTTFGSPSSNFLSPI